MSREIKSPPVSISSSRSFDGKHEIAFNESSHRYKWLCKCHKGESATGVTTFLKAGMPTPPGLISWMKGQTADYIFRTLTCPVYDGYQAMGTWSEDQKKEVIAKAKLADREVSQEAADIGTVLHGYSELHSLGKIEEAKALLQQVSEVEKFPIILKCVEKYHVWDTRRKGTLIEAESLVASPGFNFCGKIDRLDRVNGKLILRDYKTSKAIFIEHKIQLAAYRLAIFQWKGLQIDAIEILRFGKTDGEFETCLIEDANELQELEAQAIRCRLTHSFIQKYDKSMH